jgi:hypothetical protein
LPVFEVFGEHWSLPRRDVLRVLGVELEIRRLAKASREDVYASKRDYQEIVIKKTLELRFKEHSAPRMVLSHSPNGSNVSDFYGFGAYVFVPSDVRVAIQLMVGGTTLAERTYELVRGWNRLGLATQSPGDDQIKVSLDFSKPLERISLWGVNAGSARLPKAVLDKSPTVSSLNSPFICPETLYLDHSVSVAIDIVAEESADLRTQPSQGRTIETKKCSYCQRMLPINSAKLGSLAFHKHNAKRTKHQNECRACKKWRINDSFNPQRTTDQLHESSVITRERSVLLREPEILQRIKDRHGGAGLKSIVWEHFGRRCFRCRAPLKLSEVELDHTRPLAYLWPIDEHATCLCSECNNLKKDKFPCDVYNEKQLRELSELTGLSLMQLTTRDVNEVELRRIMTNIEDFAHHWSARTFNATARKVNEIRPTVDLAEVLRKKNPALHAMLLLELKRRPEETTA